MERSEKSIPDMETDFREIEARDEAVYKMASDGYFRRPEMVKFLMIDSLALKLLLREKGLITAEELEQSKKDAAKFLEIEVRRQIDEWRKQNPQEATLFNIIAAKRGSDARRKPDDGD